MLRIRLSRGGKKRQPHYRVVVADSGSKRDGRVVERIGYYDPLANPAECRIKEDRALHWLSVGAQPSDAVQQLLERQGTIARFKRYRAGEPIEALVAEFEGRSLEPVVAAAPAAMAQEVAPAAMVAETAVAEAVDEEEPEVAEAAWNETASQADEELEGDSDDQPAGSEMSDEAEGGEEA